GNWDLAEECAQEAFVEAVRKWPADGVPQRPIAWLTTVAGNRAIDRLRREARGAQLLERIGLEAGEESMFDEAEEIEDDRLRLIFTCDQPEVAGALALMLLQHSRRRARLDDDGELVTLEDQDRARWDRAEIDEALEMLESALRRGAAGPYQVQAAIAACHARAATAAEI